MRSRDRIFICYRREGGAELARLVHDNLRERGFDVFMDVENLKSGQFNRALLLEIESASDVVVILTPNSLDRCVDEGDWLRWEISHAIASRKNVIPLVARGFTWPTQGLPKELEELPYFQGVEPSHSLFNASMDKLVDLLKARPKLRRPVFYALVGIGLSALLAVGAWQVGLKRGKSSTTIQQAREKPDADGWFPLFQDNDLSGWVAPEGGDWKVRNQALIGKGRLSHLFSPYAYTNFEFKAQIRLSRGGQSAIFFRCQPSQGVPAGYRCVLDNGAARNGRTGTVIATKVANINPTAPKPLRDIEDNRIVLQRVTSREIADKSWWTHHIVVVGNRVIVRVNDEIIVDAVDTNVTHHAGHFALQQFESPKVKDSVVMFRNVMAKRLPSDEKAALATLKKDIPDLANPR